MHLFVQSCFPARVMTRALFVVDDNDDDDDDNDDDNDNDNDNDDDDDDNDNVTDDDVHLS